MYDTKYHMQESVEEQSQTRSKVEEHSVHSSSVANIFKMLTRGALIWCQFCLTIYFDCFSVILIFNLNSFSFIFFTYAPMLQVANETHTSLVEKES